METFPVALFVYARPEETLKTINALKENYLAPETKLYIFSDGAKSDKDSLQVENVRKIINGISEGFKKIIIIERQENFGLAKSIITGVSQVLEEHSAVIVVEEDLISSRNFLNFLNASLSFYKTNNKVFSVTGYTYQLDIPQEYEFDNYFMPRCESLGWGTWKDRWIKVDWEVKDFRQFIRNKKLKKKFDSIGTDLYGMLLRQKVGLLDSWAVRWCYAHFKNDAYCSYPIRSKIIHIGEGGFATHVKNENKLLETELDDELKTEFRFSSNVFLDKSIVMQYQKMFKKKFTKRLRTMYYRMLFELKR